MFTFQRRKPAQRKHPAASVKRWRSKPAGRTRLMLEPLEDRTVPSVLFDPYYGHEIASGIASQGQALSNGADINLLFWGSYWFNNIGEADNIAGSAENIFASSPYLDGLKQYGINNRAFLYSGTSVSSDPPNGFTDSQLQTEITIDLNNGSLPAPNQSPLTPIYLVFTPPGTQYSDPQVRAYHNWFQTLVVSNGAPQVDQVIYAWVGNFGGTDGVSYLMSREMAETMTDPFFNGVRVTPGYAWTGSVDNEIGGQEAENYTYRLNGDLVQSYWSQADEQYLVPDGNTQGFLVSPHYDNGGRFLGGTLTVNGDQLGFNYDDLISIDDKYTGGAYVFLNFEIASFDPGQISEIDIFPGGGANIIGVANTNVPVNIDSESTDEVGIGNRNDGVQGIVATVNVSNPPAYTDLIVDDSADTVPQTAYISSDSVIGLAPANITYNGADLSSFSIYGGSGGGNVFYVTDTPSSLANVVTYLNSGSGFENEVDVQGTTGDLKVDGGSGEQIVTIGSLAPLFGGTVANIHGQVTAYNSDPKGFSYLFIDDSGDLIGQFVSMQDGSINGLAPAFINWGDGVIYVNVRGGKGYNDFTVHSTSNLFIGTDLVTGSGGAFVQVQSTSGPLNVINDGGQDMVYIGFLTVGGINGNVDVYGPGSTDLIVDDSQDGSSQTVSMLDGSITGLAPASISWTPSFNATGGVTELDVQAGLGSNTFNVYGTSNFYHATYLLSPELGQSFIFVNVSATTGALNVDGGGDQQFVTIGSLAPNFGGTVAAIAGPVDVYNSGGSGASYLYIDDSGDTSSKTASMDQGSITGLAPATISWTSTDQTSGGVVSLAVYGGSGGNTFNVYGTSNFYYATYLVSGSGNSSSNYVNIQATSGKLDVDGGNDEQLVTIGSLAPKLGGTVAAIFGQVDVFNSGSFGFSFLTVDDSEDLASQSASLFDGKISGLAPADIEWSPGSAQTGLGGVDSLLVLGGSGSNSFDVASTSNFINGTLLHTGTGGATVSVETTTGLLNIINDGGQDFVTIGSFNDGVAQINGTVDVYGPGSTTLAVDDSADTKSENVSMYDGMLTGMAPATISWSPSANAAGGVNQLNVYGGSGGNVFTVYGTSDFYLSTLLVSGSGSSSFNYVYIQATSGFLAVDGGGDGQAVTIGSGGTLANINGTVEVSNFLSTGYSYLYMDDILDSSAKQATLSDGSLTGLAPATLLWTPSATLTGGVTDLVVYGGSAANTFTVANTSRLYYDTSLYAEAGSDIFNVQATTGGLYVNGGTGANTVNVGNAAKKLDDIKGFVDVTGASGVTKLVINDQGSNTAYKYTVDNGKVQRPGEASIQYGSLTSLLVNGSSVGSTYNVLSTAAGTATTVNPGGGNNNLVTVGDVNGVQDIRGTLTISNSSGHSILIVDDSGAPTGRTATIGSTDITGLAPVAINYTPTQLSLLSIKGGPWNDKFIVANTQFPMPVKLDGGGGVNTLDYSKYVGDVAVNLLLGTATDFAGGISNIQNVTGSQGNDLLVGDANPNVLVGGTGRNIIIGGAGADTITGSVNQDNILIGGTTLWDTNMTDLMLIMHEWLRMDLNFKQRLSDLSSGGTTVPNSVLLGTGVALNNSTVLADASVDTLNEPNNNVTGQYWFFVDVGDIVPYFKNGKYGDHLTKV